MNKRLLLATTAVAAMAMVTAAVAQSPSTSSSSSSPSSSSSTPSSSSSSSSPSSSSPSSSTSTSSGTAQTTSPSSSSTNQAQSSSTGQNATGQSATGTSQTPSSSTSTNRAQTTSPSNQTNPASSQTQTGQSSSTQSANPPATNNHTQASQPGGGSSTTAQQPNNQRNTADRSSNTNVNASVNINDQQRTRIGTSISHLNVQPLNNVNFSLSVGTAVPRDIRMQPLPTDVVEVVPQYRGYDFVLVKDEIVIVEPSSYKIVAVMPYSGRSTAAAPARTEQRKVTFSDRDRDVVRKHARARAVERQTTTGSAVRTEMRMGERVPDSVEIEAFPEEVYRDAPDLREYRYIHRDSRTYVVEPQERRIIEEID